MNPGRGLSDQMVTAGWAVIGLLLGHVAAYDIVYPDAHVHETALASSGHGWLVALGPSLVIAFLAAVLAAVIGSRTGRPRAARFRTLAFIQIVAFLAMELGERLVAGLTLAAIGHELFEHGLWLILATGMVVQVATAWLGSAASRHITAATIPGPSPMRRRQRPPLLPRPSVAALWPRPVIVPRGRAPPDGIASIRL